MLTTIVLALAAYLMTGLIVNSTCAMVIRAFDPTFLRNHEITDFVEAITAWPLILVCTIVIGLTKLFQLLVNALTKLIEMGLE